jgi:indoleamine 2,3-dioxygenase
MARLILADYDISPERGFLSRHDAPDVTLQGKMAQARDVAMALPKILVSGRARAFMLRDLPTNVAPADIDALTDAEARMAMVHYSFLVQAYVWGEDDAPSVLPRALAVPIHALAQRLGQQPLLPYSGYVLDNWGMFDADKPIDLENIFMVQPFLGGQDEAWFVLVHVAIEARAGRVLEAIPAILNAIETHDAETVTRELSGMAGHWAAINALFDRMPERCDPHNYFTRVRPYIHGWKDNPALPGGLIYEGVEDYAGKPQSFRGQTGSQSSIVPTMDALMQVGHADDPLKAYLDQLHIYRPPGHRNFIDAVRAQSTLRQFVQDTDVRELTLAYNGIIQAVADFRSRHLEYAASYIQKQGKTSAGNDPDVGTGGTPFMRYLKKHRDETKARLLAA